MLGPHFPPQPLGPGEGRPTPCTFQIPDGSYRCLALEAEESSSEEGLQGEVGPMDQGENKVASNSSGSSNSAWRATQGLPQLPRALGIQPPRCSREAPGGSQHDNRANQDWNVVKAQQVMTASPSPSPSPGPRVAQKPGVVDAQAGISPTFPPTLLSEIILSSL